MRRTILYLSLLAAAITPLTASAASLDLLTINSSSGIYTVLLPNQPLVDAPSQFSAQPTIDQFTLTGLTVTGPGGVKGTNETVVFFDSNYGGGLQDFSTIPDLNFGNNAPTSLFNDDDSNPIFTITSSGTLLDFSYTVQPSYSLLPVSTSPVPEPSSLILLGTSGLGLASAFRRRIFA